MSLPSQLSYNTSVKKVYKTLIDHLDRKIDKFISNHTNNSIPELTVGDTIEYKNNDGMYVFSKQPIIKELWVSSPVSGSWKFKMNGEQFVGNGKELMEFVENEIK